MVLLSSSLRDRQDPEEREDVQEQGEPLPQIRPVPAVQGGVLVLEVDGQSVSVPLTTPHSSCCDHVAFFLCRLFVPLMKKSATEFNWTSDTEYHVCCHRAETLLFCYFSDPTRHVFSDE